MRLTAFIGALGAFAAFATTSAALQQGQPSNSSVFAQLDTTWTSLGAASATLLIGFIVNTIRMLRDLRLDHRRPAGTAAGRQRCQRLSRLTDRVLIRRSMKARRRRHRHACHLPLHRQRQPRHCPRRRRPVYR